MVARCLGTVLSGLLISVQIGWMPRAALGQAPAQRGSPQSAARYMPNETIAVISAWPKQLAAKKRLELAPLEVITAAGLEQVGVDPLQIERLDVMIAVPGLAGPQFGALVQSSAAVDIQKLNPQMLRGDGMQTDGKFEYLTLAAPQEIVLHQVDPNTVIVGTKIFAKQMVAARNAPGPVAAIAVSIQSSQDVLAIVSISTLRPLLLGLMEGQLRQLPPAVVQDLNVVVESTEYVALRAVIDDPEKLQIVLSGKDAASADAMENSLKHALQFAQQSIVEDAKGQLPPNSQTSTAMSKYLDRVSVVVVESMTPKRAGNRLVLEVQGLQNVGVIGTLTGLLLPAVQAAREAARRMQSSNNLKQIGLALHNFADAYKAFPATAGMDANGKPLISWRVAILPFIEQQALYEKFHMDEPWDSEHNIKLLAEMPAVYKHPSRVTKPGHTVYQAVVSDKSLLRLTEPTTFQQITDGTSNTILALETTADVAVPWTAPQDYKVDEAKPHARLFLRGITQALFGDGSVRVLAESIDKDILNALYTRDGGEVTQNF